jgi:drug/metabolite transporter (DMT)-like permease
LKNQFFKKYESELGLLLAAILWGITFPLIRLGVKDLDAFYFVAFRFTLAFVFLLPFVCAQREMRAELVKAWPLGLLLGAISSVGYITQTIGLETIPAPRAAFITGMYVILVPLLSPIFSRRWPSKIEVAGALLATFGMYLLVDPNAGGITSGDLWVFLCALGTATHLHCLQNVTKRRHFHPLVLVFLQIVGVMLCAWATVPLAAEGRLVMNGAVITTLILCGLGVTIGSFWLQARYQKGVTPEKAALIYSMEPVFATVLGFFLIDETLTLQGLMGAGLILTAVILCVGLTKNESPEVPEISLTP